MWKKFFFFPLLFTFFLYPEVSIAVNTTNGEKIFQLNCSACHAGGVNAIVAEKTLKKDILEKNGMDDNDAIIYQVTNGKNAMPAFGGRLNDKDIEDVAFFVLKQSENGWK